MWNVIKILKKFRTLVTFCIIELTKGYNNNNFIMNKQLLTFRSLIVLALLFELNMSFAQLTLIDVVPGPPSSFPAGFEVVGPLIFFGAEDPASDFEPHVYDTGMGGMPMKIDINPMGSSAPAEFTEVGGDKVFFSAEDEFGDRELYIFDLGVGSPVKIDVDPTGSSFPFRLTNLGGTLYFTATVAGDTEAYYYDGAMPVKIDTDPTGSGDPEEYTFVGGMVFFVATASGDEELYKFDGVTLTKIDVNPTASSDPNELTSVSTVVGSKLFFNAESTTGDKELHKYDPVSSMLTEIDVSATGSSSPFALYDADGILYFTASDLGDVEMYEYDDVATLLTKIDIDPVGSSFPAIFPGNYKKVGAFIYVPAEIAATGDRELYKFDIGSGMTTKVDVNPVGPSAPLELTELDGILYFTADEGPDKELYQYDGTTLMKIELNPTGDGFAAGLTPAPGALYLKGTDGMAGVEMFEYIDMTLGNDSFTLNNDLKMYPNPLAANSMLTMKFLNNTQIEKVTIYNIFGALIESIENGQGSSSLDIPISVYAPGIYLIHVKSSDGNFLRKLVVK